MKNILVAVACCLTWQASIHAAALALNGNAASAASSAVNPGTERIMQLDLGSRPEEAGVLLDETGVNALAVPAPAVNATPATGWVSTGTVQSLTLDARPKPRGLATLPGELPGSAAGLGVSDSAIYAGLGSLAVALGWACSGWVSRPRSAGPVQVLDRQSFGRTRRVKMIPLNVGH